MKLPEFMHTSAYKEQQALEAAMRQQNRERRAIEKQQEKQQYEQEMASLKKTVDELHKIETMRAETAKPLHKELVARSNMDPVSPMFGQGLYGTPEISPLQTTPRPLSRINPLQQAGIQYPASPMSMYDLYNVAKASDVLGKVLNAFKRDLFRRGIVWKPLFSKRCKNCKTEYDTPVDSCEVCQAQEIPRTGDFEKPDPRQKAKFSKFLRLANESGQTLKHILRQLEDDINITDNGWLIIRKEYLTVAQPKEEASEEESFSMMNLQKEQVDAFAAKLGKVSFKEIHKALYDYAINGVLWSETRELIRGDPLRMRIVGNARGMLGGHFWVCLDHRTRPEDKYRGLQAAEARWSYGEGAGIIRSFVRLYEEPGRCQEANCGKDLHEVYSAATDGGTAVQEAYVAGEVIHIKRFDPTLTYGYTPLGHCWKDVTTRLRMKQYLNEYFRYFRYPRGVLVAMTDNPESFYRFWDAQMDRLRYDSWHIPALAIEKRDGKGFFDFVKFSGTFEELQYGDNIADTEKAVFEVYGVMRAAADSNMGVTGDYIRLTPGAMMWHQESYEEFLFPRLLEQFHITDWNLEILPTEEDDEMELINIRLKKIEEAERMLAVGMKVRYTATKDFEFSGQPKSQEELMGGGGQMPGMFGQEDFGGGGEEGGGEESPETGEDEDTGEDEESQIDSLIQDMLGGESTKDRGREQRGGGVAKAKQKK